MALTPWQRRLLDAENDPWRLWFLVITQPPVGVLLLVFAVTERKSPFWVGLLGAHGRVQDVEVTDIGSPVEEDPGRPIEPA